MNLALTQARISRLFGRPQATVRDVSQKEWVLHSATVATVPPAIFSESDLQRVTSVMEETTLDMELRRIRGGHRDHAATTVFEISNVELRDGFVFKGPWVYRLLRARAKSPSATPVITVPDAVIGCTLLGSIYFAHWITDDLTLQLAAEQLGIPVGVERNPYRQEVDYRLLFDTPPSVFQRARFPRFTMLADFGQNKYKEERYRSLRQRLRAACPSRVAHPRIYLRRGTRGAPRTLVNTAEVETFLSSQGFVLIDPDQNSPAEIAQIANGAKIAISVEGSHMVHGLVNIADGGTILQIQPPDRFNNLFKDYTDCLGMRYGFTVGLPAEGGFHLPIEDLRRFLDHVDSAVHI
jgi:Glycosyltransferase 61